MLIGAPVTWMRKQINLSRSGAGAAGGYDPNRGLDEEVRDWAASLSVWPFESALIQPQGVRWNGEHHPDLIFADAGDTGHLVYVRVTLGDEQETGTGPMPGVLTDMARDIRAEPHVVRVHLSPAKEGTNIDYFGHSELAQTLQSGNHWNRRLIGRRTARDYLGLVGGRLSKLTLHVAQEPPGKWPKVERPAPVTEEEKLLREIFGETGEEELNDFPGSLSMIVSVDTLSPQLSLATISLTALANSAVKSGEHFIRTCTCGAPECAGIWRGIETVHEDGLVVWRVRGMRPRRVAVFDREQYRSEVLSKLRDIVALKREMDPRAWFAGSDDLQMVEAALRRAEQG